MNVSKKNAPYEGRIKINDKIISKTTGKDLEKLKVLLTELCDLEHSGAYGEILEFATGQIIYKCHKQTIIDQ